MNLRRCAWGFSILGILAFLPVKGNDHGGVHIHIPTCEDANEEENEQLPAYCVELKPWYHHQHFDEYEDIKDQSDRLQDDTSWPGQRQDFSDYLLR